MINDPIVAEVRRIREEYARRFNYDLWAIFEDLKQKEQNADQPTVDRSKPPRSKERGEESPSRHAPDHPAG